MKSKPDPSDAPDYVDGPSRPGRALVHPWRVELAGLTVMNRRGHGQHLGAAVVVWLAGAVAAGCVPSGVPAERGEGIVVVERGLAERLALMDRYRLHDEDRKRMMARPHVWVEEVPDDEVPRSNDGAAAPGFESSSSSRENEGAGISPQRPADGRVKASNEPDSAH